MREAKPKVNTDTEFSQKDINPDIQCKQSFALFISVCESRSSVYFTRTESREGKMKTCGPVQFSGCKESYKAAGCAYLLQRSVDLKDELKWVQIPFLHLHLQPTILHIFHP